MKEIQQLFPKIFEVIYHCTIKGLIPLVMQFQIIKKSIKKVLKNSFYIFTMVLLKDDNCKERKDCKISHPSLLSQGDALYNSCVKGSLNNL